MKVDSLASRYEAFLGAACLACHVSFRGEGFRVRDTRFYTELFSNWARFGHGADVLAIQDTQVLRYLQALVAEGFARKLKRKARPEYALSRVGVIEILSRIRSKVYRPTPSLFFFVYYFLHCYRNTILRLIKSEGSQFPPAFQAEVQTLLDTQILLREEIEEVEREIAKVKTDCRQGRECSALVTAGKEMGVPFPTTVSEIQRKYPYAFNSLKPLKKLMEEVPEGQREWGLQHGLLQRIETIWEPSRMLLECYREQLVMLKEREGGERDSVLP